MTNETTDNFLQVMATFQWPDPKPIFYRLYYNDNGTPICYTMDDLPGKYVEVDRDTYVKNLWNVRVINGKLQIIPPLITVKKLQPNKKAGTTCHTNDVCVIVSLDQPHTKWSLVTHETN